MAQKCDSIREESWNQALAAIELEKEQSRLELEVIYALHEDTVNKLRKKHIICQNRTTILQKNWVVVISVFLWTKF